MLLSRSGPAILGALSALLLACSGTSGSAVPIAEVKLADPTCAAGSKWDGGQCVGTQAPCPPGTKREGPRCAPIACAEGTHPTEDGECVASAPVKRVDTAQADAATAATIAAVAAPGGGEEWDTAVTAILLGAYDRDHSSLIDNKGELASISCVVYRAMDEGIRQNHVGLRVTYGFRADMTWVGTLGIAEAMREAADQAMSTCGLP